jgi:hypothetical protein
MFKERLMIVLKKIGYWVGMFLISGIILAVILFLVSKIPNTETVMEYTLFTVVGIAALFALIGVVLKVVHFIKWLFIEPFKKKKS